MVLVLRSLVATSPGKEGVLKASVHLERWQQEVWRQPSLLGDPGCVTPPLQPPAGELGVRQVSVPFS